MAVGSVKNSSVGGDASINVSTGNLASAAIGVGQYSKLHVGNVVNTSVGGSARINVSTGDLAAFSIGAGPFSVRNEVSIGNVGN